MDVIPIISDNFGPEYLLRVHDGDTGMEGFLVVDNTALGPGKGGVRMTPNITIEEVFRLARTMTWKNALAGIPFGGAKAGIVWPPRNMKFDIRSKEAEDLKKTHIESFARALKFLIPLKYIAGPDVNSGEKEMQWFAEAIGNWQSATGKPVSFCEGDKCGLPHELGSTGFGVAQATKVAAGAIGLKIEGVTVAIEGFGNVGAFAFKHLKEMGAKIVAVSDSRGCAYFPSGLDGEILRKLKAEKKSVTDYPGVEKIEAEKLFGLPVDILIPAAVTDVINESNKNSIKAKIIIEGANIPMRENIESELHEKGILIVPDFVANAGGVISSYAEYMGFSPDKMFEVVEDKITQATKEIVSKSLRDKENPRKVALTIAKEKVLAAMKLRKQIFS